jgi:chromosome segregation ATPase
MRDLLEEVEDQLANTLKELNQKAQESQRYKTMLEASNVKLEQMRDVIRQKDQIIQDGGLLPEGGEEEEAETQAGLLQEIDNLRQELIAEQNKKSNLNDEEIQIKEKLYQETKSRANKLDQEVEAQKLTIARLEGQVSRYKAAADHYESSEDNLKADKRRLQRELRQCQEKLEEVELTNEHLEKRLEKIRAARQKS